MFFRRGYSSHRDLVRGLRTEGVLKNDRAFNAMLNTDRKYYCPDPAYEDMPQPIGYGQTISAPQIHAWFVDVLSDYLRPGARALDVGSGTGILTAMMGHMVSPSGKVFGIDNVPELVEKSENSLREDPQANKLMNKGIISVAVGDGWQGLPNEGPFDAIQVGAAADIIPPNLLAQLKAPGRMVIPVGPPFAQEMITVDKDEEGNVTRHKITDVMFVPLTKKESAE